MFMQKYGPSSSRACILFVPNVQITDDKLSYNVAIGLVDQVYNKHVTMKVLISAETQTKT